MLFTEHPNEGISYLLGFFKVMQYPFHSFKIYVIHPKTFLRYPKWGIANSIHFFGHEQCPSNGVVENDSAHGVL